MCTLSSAALVNTSFPLLSVPVSFRSPPFIPLSPKVATIIVSTALGRLCRDEASVPGSNVHLVTEIVQLETGPCFPSSPPLLVGWLCHASFHPLKYPHRSLLNFASVPPVTALLWGRACFSFSALGLLHCCSFFSRPGLLIGSALGQPFCDERTLTRCDP